MYWGPAIVTKVRSRGLGRYHLLWYACYEPMIGISGVFFLVSGICRWIDHKFGAHLVASFLQLQHQLALTDFGRDAQFSLTHGRMYLQLRNVLCKAWSTILSWKIERIADSVGREPWGRYGKSRCATNIPIRPVKSIAWIACAGKVDGDVHEMGRCCSARAMGSRVARLLVCIHRVLGGSLFREMIISARCKGFSFLCS